MIGFIVTILLSALCGAVFVLFVVMWIVIWFAADPDGRPPNSEKH